MKHVLWSSRIAVAAVCVGSGAAVADVIQTPTITITSVPSTRQYFAESDTTRQRDAVSIPEDASAYTGGGAFSASIATGDTVIMRVEAPAGHRFRIRHVPQSTNQYFQASMVFIANGNDTFENLHSGTVTFVDAAGVTPVSPNEIGALISDNAGIIGIVEHVDVVGDFTFTALEARWVVGPGVEDVERAYEAIQSFDSVSFGVFTELAGNVAVVPAFAVEPMVGACCVDGTCIVTIAPDCTGEFIGADSACTATVRGGQVINTCCPADFDGDSTLGVPDIFAFLTAWFSGCP